MKQFKFILSILIVLTSIFLCQQIISISISNQDNKKDYAELNHIKYGLFSIDKWKDQISIILVNEINKLSLTSKDEKELKNHIEAQLNILIDKVNQKIKERNSDSATGWVKQAFINIFISLDDIKKGIPEYADAAIREMKKANTKDQVKTIIKNQLDQYFKQTFDTQDTSRLKEILQKTNSPDIESAKVKVNAAVTLNHQLISNMSILLIILSVVLFGIPAFSRETLSSPHYIMLVLSLLILLTAGVTTPMIDMEAKISQMSFVLMEHPVHFENQVLYFQSKSILDVFWIMIIDKALAMKFVGILMVTFSIFIPVLKILSTIGHYYNYRHARDNSVIKFFVLKAGKWSMADVMVVAIFMAYVGFNGIITSQFGHLSTAGQELVLLTTNGTSLQPGYYLFLVYVLLSLFLSLFLTRKPQDVK